MADAAPWRLSYGATHPNSLATEAFGFAFGRQT